MENGKVLHVVVFPWLAMGHIIPFLHLSKQIAQKGHRVSFVSTPRNLQRLPKIPPNLLPLINLVTLPLPHVPPLPDYAESSTDIPTHQSQFLKKAFDMLESPLATFLETTTPDWIIYDYASHWLPPLAAKLGISRTYFSLFTAACLAFLGPLDGKEVRTTAEDFTVVPKWVPFESDVKYRLHEVLISFEGSSGNESGTSDMVRFETSIGESDFVAVRSSAEFEPEWLNLLSQLYRKPVVPVGFLPPLSEQEHGDDDDETWTDIKKSLDKQRFESVVYVALGSEASLSQEELNEFALGLERSELPFFWVLRNPPWSTQDQFQMLPDGFVERVKGRGVVYVGWAPQVKILSHESVGGFLTHCGWNSVIEGLGFGRVLILFPVLNDQGLNARQLNGKKLGVEVPRNERDGSFKRDSVAESVKLAMVSEEGGSLRMAAKEMKGLFGDRNRNDQCVDSFVNYLEEYRRQSNSN